MHSFPRIEHVDDLLPHIKDKPEIIKIEKDNSIIFDYVYQTPDTFDNPYALECRGIKFHKNSGLSLIWGKRSSICSIRGKECI